MVGSTLAIRSKMASPSAAMQLSSLSRRSLSTRPQILRSARPLRQQQFQRSARRSYADAAPAAPTPKPKKRFRFLRWTWRLTWLSTIGAAGAVAYSVYELRHPAEQIKPDPTKKTLVILGRFLAPCVAYRDTIAAEQQLTSHSPIRYRMGYCFPTEEARH